MKHLPFILLILFSFISCKEYNKESIARLEYALSMAGENRKELEKVLQHYKDDSLKLQAARFLITNMRYHFSRDEYLLSPEREKYRPDVTLFNTKEKISRHCDSLYIRGYQVVKEKKYDIVTLDSAYLVENIELAFALKKKEWVKDVPFEDFCRYILPYRIQNEIPSRSRKAYMERFLPYLEIAKVKTPLEASLVINQELTGMIHFDEISNPLYPTVEEAYQAGFGTCDGMNITVIFIMRAVGIPVTQEQTIWVKGDRGHVWASVINEGRFIPFAPCSDPPHRLNRQLSAWRPLRPGKVYRWHFDPVHSISPKEDDGYVTFLKSPLLSDVTCEYPNPVIDIETTTDKEAGNDTSPIYLCAYNYYGWKVVAIGQRNKNLCRIHNVVGDNVFIIADSPNGKRLRYLTAPFIVHATGGIHKLHPDTSHKISRTIRKKGGQWNTLHTLQYWDTQHEEFTSLQEKSTTDSTLLFANEIPDNALLRFDLPKKPFEVRPFIIQNDSIKDF